MTCESKHHIEGYIEVHASAAIDVVCYQYMLTFLINETAKFNC